VTGEVGGGAAYPLNVAGSGQSQFGVNLLVGPELDAGFEVEGLTVGLGLSLLYVPLDAGDSDLGATFVAARCDPTVPRDVACAPAESLIAGEAAHGSFLVVAPSARLGYRF
jgi:hypothetical protein